MNKVNCFHHPTVHIRFGENDRVPEWTAFGLERLRKPLALPYSYACTGDVSLKQTPPSPGPQLPAPFAPNRSSQCRRVIAIFGIGIGITIDVDVVIVIEIDIDTKQSSASIKPTLLQPARLTRPPAHALPPPPLSPMTLTTLE